MEKREKKKLDFGDGGNVDTKERACDQPLQINSKETPTFEVKNKHFHSNSVP